MQDTILKIQNISKFYPGVTALNNVSFEIKAGEARALCGENGAGKSTLIKCIMGVERPDEGKVLMNYNGDWIENTSALEAQSHGVYANYQHVNIAPDLSIAENYFLGRQPKTKLGMVDWKKMYDDSQKIIDKFGMNVDPRQKISSLPIAMQAMVTISKISVSDDLRIVIFDEPTALLENEKVETLYKFIDELKSKGVSIIYISHRLEELAHITDRVTIMRDGHYITEGNFTDFTMDEIIANMVGREIKEKFPHVECEKGKKVFEVKNLNAGRLVRDINFSLYEGEIVGFAGLMGAGRTETTRAIFGVDPKESGTLILDGKEITINNPMDAIKAGVVLAPEDRKKDGLCTKLSIRHNIALPNLDLICGKGGVINTKVEEELCDKAVADLTIKTPNLDVDAGTLSGGNQQKVVVGKWLARNSRVEIFDEPTRGIDVGAKVEIYQLMNQLKKQGIAVMFVSSEMPEVMGVADRIIVMCDGRITGEVMAKETTQNDILKYATSFENKLGSQSQNNKEE